MEESARERHVLVSHARPDAYAPMTCAMLAHLGYRILDGEAFAREAGEDARPDLYLVDERSLAELVEETDAATPVVLLTGRHGATGVDPRVAGALQRPAGMHELYRLLQHVLEDTPRSLPRVPTHLGARCRSQGREWRGSLLSLSENGCLLRTPEPLLLGERLDLSFALPGTGAVELAGEVGYQLLPDLGVIFQSTSPSARRAIGGYVAKALTAA